MVRCFVIAMKNVAKDKLPHSLVTDSRKKQLVMQLQACTVDDLWLRCEAQGSYIEPVAISDSPVVNR